MISVEIEEVIRSASRASAAEMMKAINPETDRISQRKAYAEYGFAFVKKCEKDGLMVWRSGSSKNSIKYYSRAQLIQKMEAQNIFRNIIKIKQNGNH